MEIRLMGQFLESGMVCCIWHNLFSQTESVSKKQPEVKKRKEKRERITRVLVFFFLFFSQQGAYSGIAILHESSPSHWLCLQFVSEDATVNFKKKKKSSRALTSCGTEKANTQHVINICFLFIYFLYEWSGVWEHNRAELTGQPHLRSCFRRSWAKVLISYRAWRSIIKLHRRRQELHNAHTYTRYPWPKKRNSIFFTELW